SKLASAFPAVVVLPVLPPVNTVPDPTGTGSPLLRGASWTSAVVLAVSVLAVLADSVTISVTGNEKGGTVEPDSSAKVCMSVIVYDVPPAPPTCVMSRLGSKFGPGWLLTVVPSP